jgi:NADPH-ferrihemoprotein reductase
VSYDQKNPYYATIHSWKELFAPGLREDPNDPKSLERNCLHVEFDLSGTNMRYVAGDHLGIYPVNDQVEVEKLAKALGIHDRLDTVFEMKSVEGNHYEKSVFKRR